MSDETPISAVRVTSMRRRPRQPRQRQCRVTVRFSPDEYGRVAANAAASRLTVAAYVAESALVPRRPPELVGRTDQQATLRELMGLHRQVHGAAVNLNQAVAKLHSIGEPVGELPRAAAEMARLAARVDDVIATVASVSRRR